MWLVLSEGEAVHNIAIVGAGAIGLFVGGKLLEQGNQISFVARSNFSQVKSEGFILKMNNGADVNVYKPHHVFNALTQLAPQSQDCVILCTTAADNVGYLDDLMRIIKPNGLVVSLQNGINFETAIYNEIKPCTLLSGTCWIKVSKQAPTHIVHNFGMRIILGIYPLKKMGLENSSILRFNSVMLAAGFNVELVDSYLAPQLTKLAINLPFFGLMLRYGVKQAKVVKRHNAELMTLQGEIINVAREQLSIEVDTVFIAQTNEQLSKLPELDLGLDEKQRLEKEIAPIFQDFVDLISSPKMSVPQLMKLFA